MVLTRRPGKECSPFVCNEVTRTGSYACCGKFIFFRRVWKRGSERRGSLVLGRGDAAHETLDHADVGLRPWFV